MSRSAVCPRCDAVNSVDEDQWGTRVPCDARGSYAAAGFGMKLAVEVDDDLTQQDRNDLFRWGDQSQCVLLLKNGKPVWVPLYAEVRAALDAVPAPAGAESARRTACVGDRDCRLEAEL